MKISQLASKQNPAAQVTDPSTSTKARADALTRLVQERIVSALPPSGRITP